MTATAGARTLVLAFGLLAWTSATSGCGEPGPDPAYDSHAPTGMAAFPRLLRAAGIDVTVHRGSVADMPQDTQVVVLRTSGTDPKKMAKSLRFDPFLEDELSPGGHRRPLAVRTLLIDHLYGAFSVPKAPSPRTKRPRSKTEETQRPLQKPRLPKDSKWSSTNRCSAVKISGL